MMKSILGCLVALSAGAVVGVLAFRLIAIEGEWLYTDFDYTQALKEQRVSYYAKMCDVLGEHEWVEDGKSLASLQDIDNTGLRIRFADQTTADMRIEDALETLVSSKCADLMTTS